jgi:hypothetical protein
MAISGKYCTQRILEVARKNYVFKVFLRKKFVNTKKGLHKAHPALCGTFYSVLLQRFTRDS